ncbi:hypothetical protein [Halobaculum magnesiiphilum]|uniref:Rpa-associated protein n=1 Tax=Halobaculum magnesiiphilum TaxID=1017351 RepID=A0A8T8WBS8_9EURY|nr:hypothetical protein [Halobaculum magnesiiphilum]QZP37307.1 hypothetical protein K6T50_13635 [Halobaculum magnesiiphilum]
MSSSDGDDDGGDGGDPGPGSREVAHRLFATEFDDADLEHSESDEERAPNYVVTPTGLRVNRLFAVGVLTEVESVNEQTLRGRVVDPTGAFVTYAGQYQPDEAAFLDRTTPPAFVALTGKARTFQPEDSDLVYTSVRPESFATVDADTRDRWVVSAAEATLRRVAVFAEALSMDERGDRLRARLEDAGVPTALAAGVPLAIDHYDTGTRYLEAVRTVAVDALEVVADEREEVRALSADPGDRGEADLGPLPEVPYDFAGATAPDPEPESEPVESAESVDAADADASEADTGAADDPAAAGTDAAASTASTVDESGAHDPDEAGEPAEAADATDDSVAVAEADPGAGAEPEPVESADAGAEVDGADDDEPTAADAADEGDGDAAAATEPADAAGDPDTEASVAETDQGASAEPEPAESGGVDDLGDFEDADGDLGEFDAEADDSAVDADADPEDFEDALSDEERREVEEEHGVEFSTGSEVPDAGESGIETPEPDDDGTDPAEASEPAADSTDGSADTGAAEDASAGSDDVSAGSDDASADGDLGEFDASDEEDAATDGEDDATADVDLEDAVVDLMAELDEGDGADREAVVAAAVERHGVDPGDAEDAIQEALMSGKCYEPADGALKPI